MDSIKKLLIDKVLEHTRDLEPEEALSLVGLDFNSVLDDAIESKINSMSEKQLLELI